MLGVLQLVVVSVNVRVDKDTTFDLVTGLEALVGGRSERVGHVRSVVDGGTTGLSVPHTVGDGSNGEVCVLDLVLLVADGVVGGGDGRGGRSSRGCRRRSGGRGGRGSTSGGALGRPVDRRQARPAPPVGPVADGGSTLGLLDTVCGQRGWRRLGLVPPRREVVGRVALVWKRSLGVTSIANLQERVPSATLDRVTSVPAGNVAPVARGGRLLAAESGGLGVVLPWFTDSTKVGLVAEVEGSSLVGRGGDDLGRSGSQDGKDHGEGRVGKLHGRLVGGW